MSTSQPYLGAILRRWWIALIVTVLFTVVGFFFSDSKLDVYEASTSILIRGSSSSNSASLAEIQASRELGKTYIRLLGTTSVLNRAANELGTGLTAGQLRNKTRATTITGTQMIAVTVRDPVPETAALTANTIADVFITKQRDEQLADLARLQVALDQFGISGASQAISSQFAALDQFSIVEPAAVPASPVSPNPERDAILAGFLGLAIGLGLALLLDLMDTRIRSQDELTQLSESQTFGTLPYLTERQIQPVGEFEGYIPLIENRAYGEACRFAAVNCSYLLRSGDFSSLFAITSATPGEGKTVFTIGLGSALADMGHEVLIVDMDLRLPTIHKALRLDNEVGVTSVLLRQSKLEDSIQQSQHENISVLTGGPKLSNPTLLFGSRMMNDLISELRGAAEIVIMDTAPMIPVADTPAILLHLDSAVLVADQQLVSRRSIRQVNRLMKASSVNTLASILNRVTERDGSLNSYYYESRGYGYGYGYGYGDESANGTEPRSRSLVKAIGRTFTRLRRGPISKIRGK